MQHNHYLQSHTFNNLHPPDKGEKNIFEDNIYDSEDEEPSHAIPPVYLEPRTGFGFNEPGQGRVFHEPEQGRAFYEPGQGRVFHEPEQGSALNEPVPVGGDSHEPNSVKELTTPPSPLNTEEEEGTEVFKTRVIQGRTFGTVVGTEIGQHFISRHILSQFRVHRPPQGGICGNKKDGAESIVLSGGYEDDVDDGETVVYTGAGGFEKGRQIANQTLDNYGNAALNTSITTGLPVRVIRGYTLPSEYAPVTGYRYDGLYTVTDQWEEVRGEFSVLRFKLVRLKGQPPVPKRPKDFEFKVTKKRKLSSTTAVKKTKKLKSTEAPYNDADEEYTPNSDLSLEPMISTRPKRKKSFRNWKSLLNENKYELEDNPTIPKKSSPPNQSSTSGRKIVLGDVRKFDKGFKLDHPVQNGLSNNGKQNRFLHLELSRQDGPPSESILSGTSNTSSEIPLMTIIEEQNEQNNEPIPFLTLQDEDKAEDTKEQSLFSLDIPEVEVAATTPQQPVDFSTLNDSEVLIDPEPEENQVDFLLWGLTESCGSENNGVDVVPIEQLSLSNNFEKNFTLGNDLTTEQPLTHQQTTKTMTEVTMSTKNEKVTKKKAGKAMTEATSSTTKEQSTETPRKEMKEVDSREEMEISTDTAPEEIEIEEEAATNTTTETTTKPVLPNSRVLSPYWDSMTENGVTPLPLETRVPRRKVSSETYMQKTPRPPTLLQAPIHNRITTKQAPPKKIKVFKRLVPKKTYGSETEPLKDLLSEMPSLRKTTKSKPQKRENNESGNLWFSKPKESLSSLSATIQKLSNT